MAIVNGTNNNDELYGSDDADTIFGRGGHDFLRGYYGADTLDGGDGYDTADYAESHDGVAVNLAAGRGFGGSAEGDTLISIEGLNGSNYDDYLIGDAGYNELYGRNGDDFLDGGEGADLLMGSDHDDVLKGGGGDDILDGGWDNDTLQGGAGADTLIGGQGVDTADYTGSSVRVLVNLEQNMGDGGDATGDTYDSIENLTGSAYNDGLVGSNWDNVINGGDGDDEIDGRDGNDTLNGGRGNDTMTGGAGHDTFIVDSAGDLVVELAGKGHDYVNASASYTLAANVEVEVLQTIDYFATTAIDLTGNNLVNEVIGNNGDNVLNGGGGADTLDGRRGDDSYFVDVAGDVVTESAGNGSDRIIATASYTLQAGSEVELLRTMGSSSTAVINLTGNEFAQALQGNAAANTLNGGAAADTMFGFAGDDTYFVDNTGDLAFESVGNGSDRAIVTAGISYTLQAGSHVELLRTAGSTSTYNVNLHGNNLINTIQGNNATNVLSGGLGNDTMTGFGGSDIFRFNTALGATNVDTVTDFNVAADTIQIDNAVFVGLANGTLAASAFRIGSAAADADDRIIYNSSTGALIFDANGNAAGGATQFATLSTGLLLTNADFNVI